MASDRRKNGTFAKGRSGNPSGVRKVPLTPALSQHAPEKVAEAMAIMDQQLVPGLNLRNIDLWARGVQLDGYSSASTGIGVPGTDKRLSHRMCVPVITYNEAIDIYRGDKMAQRAIEAPIRECFRQGYEITITDEVKHDDLKEILEDKITDLELNEAIQKAMFYERAYGGAAILIGANDGRPLDQPLDLANTSSIDWLNVLEPIELLPCNYYQDPAAAKYGEVEYYELYAFTNWGVVSNGNAGQQRLPPPATSKIHESRLVIFPGIRVSRYQINTGLAGTLWGDSILTSLVDALRDFNVSWSAAGLLAVDFGQPVISVKDLMMLVAQNPGSFMARMRALEHGRSSARAILIDADKEKFERQTTSLTGFPDLLNGLSMRLASVVDMPLTLLMGQSPKGLGNEGESDVRFYYDRIRGKQTTEVGPLLKWFIKLILGTLRKRKLPKKWTIKFHELWQMSEAETAQARLTQMRTDSMAIKSGIVYPDEIRKSRYRGGYSYETQIDENRKAPGFVALPPNGTPGSPHNPGPGGAPNPNAHTVGGYARRNPISSGTEPAPKQGGDKPIGARTDAMHADELGYQREKLRKAKMAKRPQAELDLLEALVNLSTHEQAEHDAGQCDPAYCMLPHKDADGPGEAVSFADFPVVIESPKGSTREWIDTDGTPGSTTMKYDYGYIQGALGADGDCVDVYLGSDESAKWVYVIHQNKKPDFVDYDEDKVMIGWTSADTARAAYIEQYNDERFFGGMSMMSVEVFRRKIFEGAGQVTNAA